FQAEDGIRDFHVTGVQTCALPICRRGFPIGLAGEGRPTQHAQICPWASAGSKLAISSCPPRSCAIRRIGGTATWTTERSFAEITGSDEKLLHGELEIEVGLAPSLELAAEAENRKARHCHCADHEERFLNHAAAVTHRRHCLARVCR